MTTTQQIKSPTTLATRDDRIMLTYKFVIGVNQKTGATYLAQVFDGEDSLNVVRDKTRHSNYNSVEEVREAIRLETLRIRKTYKPFDTKKDDEDIELARVEAHKKKVAYHLELMRLRKEKK